MLGSTGNTDNAAACYYIDANGNRSASGAAPKDWWGDTSSSSSSSESDIVLPETIYIGHPYPNPFSTSVEIVYSLSEEEYVSLKIVDSNGNDVETLFEDQFTMVGNHNSAWTSTNVDDGYYRAFLKFENAGIECYANLKKGE